MEVVGSSGSLVDTLHAVDDEVERLGDALVVNFASPLDPPESQRLQLRPSARILTQPQVRASVELAMAEVVYTGISGHTNLQGTLFQGKKFWLSQKVPQRSRFIADVKV